MIRGISSLHGPHQAAHKFTHTHLPTPNEILDGNAAVPAALAVFTAPFGADLGG